MPGARQVVAGGLAGAVGAVGFVGVFFGEGKRTRAVMLALSYLVPAVVIIGNISIPLSFALGLIH